MTSPLARVSNHLFAISSYSNSRTVSGHHGRRLHERQFCLAPWLLTAVLNARTINTRHLSGRSDGPAGDKRLSRERIHRLGNRAKRSDWCISHSREERRKLAGGKGAWRGGLRAKDARELRGQQAHDTLDVLVSENRAEKRWPPPHAWRNSTNCREEGLHALRVVTGVHERHGLGAHHVEAWL